MQEHSYSVVVNGTPQQVWKLFWYRGPRPKTDGVGIEILHPGDETGEGLVRHCTFKVPKYLMTGGVGYSWEWLTQVKPYESWKYDAVGKPLWSKAEGFTRLEDLGDGRTRIHFTERYHAFNPVLRMLLERRVHRFISKDNDKLITKAVNSGLERMRSPTRAGGSGEAGGPVGPGDQ
ncbi:MAG: SRPBCC family protein [Acidimicrobiales bacterium]